MKLEKLKPKKSLGQNFLKDANVVQKIIEAANLKKDDVVLEVGPGTGALTKELVKHAGKVVAVELDDRLIGTLQDKFKGQENIEIVHNDILKINLSELLKNHISVIPAEAGIQKSWSNQNERLDSRLRGNDKVYYKLIANIPYYITSLIIRHFLENEVAPKEMIVMVQKEVAERIVAMSGKMSILAVSVQYYAKAEYLFDVPRNFFDPAPEVDSAVIKISRNKKQETRNKEEVKKFFQIVKAGFSARRKTLANNLANSFHKDKKEIENILEKQGFSKTVRAQELSVEEWMGLAKEIENS